VFRVARSKSPIAERTVRVVRSNDLWVRETIRPRILVAHRLVLRYRWRRESLADQEIEIFTAQNRCHDGLVGDENVTVFGCTVATRYDRCGFVPMTFTGAAINT
jgi:hypothetical protein